MTTQTYPFDLHIDIILSKAVGKYIILLGERYLRGGSSYCITSGVLKRYDVSSPGRATCVYARDRGGYTKSEFRYDDVKEIQIYNDAETVTYHLTGKLQEL